MDSQTKSKHVMSSEISPYRLARSRLLDDDNFNYSREILNGITHAMCNMLMPLCEYPAFILPNLPQDSPSKDMVEDIKIAAERINKVNRNLMRLCHGDDGSITEIDLVGMSRQILEEVSSIYNYSDKIKVDIKPEVDSAIVRGSYDALYHAIRHVFVNACEAMQDGGLLTIRISSAAIPDNSELHRLGVQPRNYLRIQIRDTGNGVDPSCRETLFNPFVSTRHGEGAGLGLSLTYRTVSHMNGYILYNPNCDPGAEFILLFPDDA